MLKRHSKLVVLLVMVTFLFSFIASAGASTFTDVSGTTAESSAIYKLNSLGIINGYTDGTFQPDNTITRAEFAKIAGYLAGLGTVAQGMQSAPSTFKDVKTSDWFNGAVNLAYAQGFVKGYPDGTFKPEAAVTEAEVVTVFMRILGYNDNLPGNWPADYISKAATLGVLDDVTFGSSEAATRGVVAIIGSATLDKNVVAYKASDNVFEEALKAGNTYTLLSDKFKNSAANNKVLVTAVRYTTDGYVIDGYDYDAASNNALTGIKVKTGAVVSGVNTVFGLEGNFVDYITDKDGKITFAKVRNVKAPVFGKIENTLTGASTQIEIGGTKYDLNDKYFYSLSKVYESGLVSTNTLTANVTLPVAGSVPITTTGLVAKDSKVKLFFNGDGKVIFISQIAADKTYVVSSVDTKNGKIKLKDNGGTIDKLGAEDHSIILKNGDNIISLSDVKAGDLLYKVENAITGNYARGFDRYIGIVDFSIPTGKLTRYYDTDDQVVIGDKTYDIADKTGVQGLFLADSVGDRVTNVEDFVGSDVTAKLDGNLEIAYMSGATTDNSGLYGVIKDAGAFSGKGTSEKWVEIATKEGKQVTFDLDGDYYDDNTAKIKAVVGNDFTLSAGKTVNLGALVKYTLDANGNVDSIKPAYVGAADPNFAQTALVRTTTTAYNAAAVGDAEADYDRLSTPAGWMYVDKNTVIFDAQNTGAYGAVTEVDPELATWADLEDAANFRADVYYDGTTIKYVVVFAGAAGISDTGNKGVYVKSYKDGSKTYGVFAVDGQMKDYEVVAGTFTSPGTIYTYDLTDNKVGGESTVGTAQISVTKINSGSFVAGGTSYVVNDKTMFVVMDGTSVDKIGEFADLDEADTVVVYADVTGADQDVAKVVVIWD